MTASCRIPQLGLAVIALYVNLIDDAWLDGEMIARLVAFLDHLAAPDDGGATANMLKSEYEGSPTDGDSHRNALANQTVGPNLATFMCSWAEIYEPPGG